MKEIIPISGDHKTVHLKKELIDYLKQLGFEALDLGAYSDKRVDYPIYALSVADKVSKGKFKRGIVLCMTGVGVSIVANKFPGIRAALISDPKVATMTKEHNNTNILALGAGFLSTEKAKEIVYNWLMAKPEGGRHQRRIEQISAIEKNNLLKANNLEYSNLLSSSQVANNEVKISASLMCANQLNMSEDVNKLIRSGVDMLHVDIIDGNFADNVSMTVDHVAKLREITSIPIDVHLMVKRPSKYIERLAKAGANFVVIHAESEENLLDNIELIKSNNMMPGIALNVDTPLDKIINLLNKISLLMFMTVKVGFKGSQFNPEVLIKIKEAKDHIEREKLNLKLMADGSIGPRTIPPLYKSGIRIFVGGTSGLFKKGSFSENLIQMKSFCN